MNYDLLMPSSVHNQEQCKEWDIGAKTPSNYRLTLNFTVYKVLINKYVC